MLNNEQLTLLTDGQIWGNNKENQLEVLNKYGNISAVTDLAILTGGYVDTSSSYTAPDDKSLKGRTGWSWTQSSYGYGDVRVVTSMARVGALGIDAIAPSAQLCYHLLYSLKSPRTE